jgi:DNA-binding SARP family transcriptional activator/tetratricopeptide (TPR) repeat protein
MVRLVTFGGLRIENGVVVNGAANPRSRLAILAVIAAGGGGGVQRGRLTAMFWPDSDDERARNALRQALFALRRDVGGVALTEGVTHLRLNPQTITSDAGDFERAIADTRYHDAVAVYAGPFLHGVNLRESPEFERWAEEQRQRYSHAFGSALESLAAVAAARGDLSAAATWWGRRSQHDPFSARVAVGYMKALAANRERGRAIQFAANYTERLKLELELEPDAEVVALAASLRAATRPGADSSATASVRHVAAGAHVVAADGGAVRPHRAMPGERVAARWWRRAIIPLAAGASVVALAVWWQVQSVAGGPPRVRVDLAIPQGDTSLSHLGSATRQEVERFLATDGHVQVVDDSVAPAASSADWIVSTTLNTRRDSVVASTRVIDRATGVAIAHLEPLAAHHSASVALLARVRDGVRGAVAALADTLYEPWARAHSRPPTYPAFQAFMQGMDAVVNEGPREAAQAFRQAMVLDSNFAEAKIWYLEQADALNAPDIDSVISVARRQRERMSPFDQYALDRQIAFMHGDLAGAYSAARRLYALAPEVQDAQVYMAFAAMSVRRYREVIRVLHAMDRSRGWLATLHQLRTFDLNAHRLLGEAPIALREWRAMRAGNPTDFGLCFQGSMIFGALGDEPGLEALAAECAALPDAPGEVASLWEQGGRAMRSGGHRAAAQRAFERALAIRRGLADQGPGARHNLAVVLSELGEWGEAHEVMKGALQPANLTHRMRMGVIAAHVGDTAAVRAAVEFFDQRPASRRGTPEADEARGFIQLALGNLEEGTRLLARARDHGKAPGFNNWYLRFELEPLRGTPRYRELLGPQ